MPEITKAQETDILDLVKPALDTITSLARNLDVTELQGFTDGNTLTFLREDGSFEIPRPTRSQVLTRVSFRG